MRIGIFFGGQAREREISFSGGKTAMENIDKSLFVPVPVFVDSLGNFILIKQDLLYKSAIREFYPPAAYQPKNFSVYIESLGQLDEKTLDNIIAEIGQRIHPNQFSSHFDFAFIAMHGPGAEDGSIQGLFEWYNIPYSGPGILGSGVGIDKIAQNDMLKLAVGLDKKTKVLQKDDWDRKSHAQLFEEIKAALGLPFVVKAPHQGSSIGVAFVKKDNLDDFEAAVGQCLFVKKLESSEWLQLDDSQKIAYIQRIIDLDTGIAMPLLLENELIAHPADLMQRIDKLATEKAELTLTSCNAEDAVLCESFVNGQEFSCGVIQKPDGEALALPPTEVVKVVEVFDFNSKYKPGATRKRIPVQASLEHNQNIQKAVKLAFEKLGFQVCTRIDGFLKEDGTVVLHDPNTIPGMSPTSLIFKQMAEIGLNVTEAINYFIRQSIRERMRTGKNTPQLASLLEKLDMALAQRKASLATRIPVEIIVDGNDASQIDESFAQARKLYGQIAASADKLPIPVFKKGDKTVSIPKNLMFKDFAEDLIQGLENNTHPLIIETREKAKEITALFS